jgi:hypothetical protein
MFVLTFNAVLRCGHVNGLVINTHAQSWVTVTQPASGDRAVERPTPILIDPDPEWRTIFGCPNINVGIRPCLQTQSVRDGYSTFVTIGGKQICLKSVTGLTDGSPGVQIYSVTSAGQSFVTCSA